MRRRILCCLAIAAAVAFQAAQAQIFGADYGEPAEVSEPDVRQLDAADEPAQTAETEPPAAEEREAQAPAATQQAAEPDAPDDGAQQADETETAAAPEKGGKKAAADNAPTPMFSKPAFELSAGVTTINGEQWTRLAFGIDVPIWKFGVFLDLELFIEPDGSLSDKGWDFKNNTADALLRKIRYVRFGHEDDPLFVKFGGLSDVTLGYGMIMDRFTNMLHYPEEKLLGLQFYLNDISPVGITLQTLVSDFAEMKDKGGIYAARLAVKPLKTSGIFLLDGLSVGGTYALDCNTQAPARKWGLNRDYALLADIRDNHSAIFNEFKEVYEYHYNQPVDSILGRGDAEKKIMDGTRSFSLYGADAGLPIISTGILSVDLYAHSAFRADTVRGWGVGVPGVAVKFWKLWGNVEFRHIEGRFTPGYFDTYYLDERYSRGLLKEKSEYIDSVDLDGIFGRLGMDVFGILKLDGAYQYMIGKDDVKNQRYEATAGLGETLTSRIPKINLAEVYVRNSNIGLDGNVKFDKKTGDPKNGDPAWLFDRTPYMYWGYRAGFEIVAGASLIWDYRYGWKINNGKLVPDNYMILQTALRF